ncbi:GlxA family transcriptional regulator [Pandoraea commovens]|uniref:HTH-type transcriptional regulator CdhR n=1 Tax=Pandoraea commovens TaxID=2508289 RepID=A0A5E4RKP2_9BURK|nr:DJ-1/PfpI family protein [Pandoraea commovens]VVD63887.1 HTH-type transcriptional regulator CdhR [Pandoraea commovens]
MEKNSKTPPFPSPPTRRVVFLVYDGYQPLDLVGPMQVFALANRDVLHPPYELTTITATPGRVHASAGPDILVEEGLERLSQADTVIIPGGPGVDAACTDIGITDAISLAQPTVRRLCSVCTGAFLLAATGVLDGRRATTHWGRCDALQAAYPNIDVQTTPIFVNDGNVWTSAGVTAGIDLALALVEQDCGYGVAASIARKLVVYLRRPGGQAQFSETLLMQESAGAQEFSALMTKVSVSPNKRWSVEELAAEMGQTPQTFQRRFKLATGCSPYAAVQDVRLARARLMLETTTSGISLIADRCGFTSEEQMRRAFQRKFGLPPAAFRSHFGIEG